MEAWKFGEILTIGGKVWGFDWQVYEWFEESAIAV